MGARTSDLEHSIVLLLNSEHSSASLMYCVLLLNHPY